MKPTEKHPIPIDRVKYVEMAPTWIVREEVLPVEADADGRNVFRSSTLTVALVQFRQK